MMEERISNIGARLIEIIPTEQREKTNLKNISLYGGAVNNEEIMHPRRQYIYATSQ